ncbi:30S ribosomal protein S18 [Patescibacteria group bacterium]|nr:30S ribosomal protein S18 [Patescibacteria group bacterium]MBU1703580.1 30S ribosomal protein S18 [Patescibacteria group bacterium]MBU1954349.1 30S ribosomal protein S18 [Patescibacteria group bacterium]
MAKNKYNKNCPFTADQIQYIDYKDIRLLKRYISKHGKIVPRYYTGVSLKYQKSLAKAIKRARMMGLLSFTSK